MIKIIFLAFFAFTGCYPCPQCTVDPTPDNPYKHNNYANQFYPPYAVIPDTISSSGIAVDTSGLELSLYDLLDRQVAEVETCLKEVLGIQSIHREWLIIKIAPDAFLDIAKDEELLPGGANPQICFNKGLCTDINDCTCYYRAGIQNNSVIVVTPSMYLLKDPLIRMVTSVNNPWQGELARCATPTVPKLSGLVLK